jgi:hypothetical protein
MAWAILISRAPAERAQKSAKRKANDNEPNSYLEARSARSHQSRKSAFQKALYIAPNFAIPSPQKRTTRWFSNLEIGNWNDLKLHGMTTSQGVYKNY